MRDEDKAFAILAGIVVFAVIGIAVAGWIIESSMEAAAFNRVTGSHVTTWDAMWIELRVQEGSKP